MLNTKQHENMQKIVKKFCLKCLECIRRGTKTHFFRIAAFFAQKNFQTKHETVSRDKLKKRVFASHDFWMVLKPSRKLEMIKKNPDSFYTIKKIENVLEKSGRL